MEFSAWLRYFICLALSASVVFLCRYIVHVNATTAALAMLLLVLGIATKWGLREGVWTSLVCVVAFNFFFLPPVGTLTIADPQNWVALTAFLVSAVVASQLSAKAKKRAEEALARRAEVERLYQLSRAMLMDDEAELTRAALSPIRDIFGLSHVAFYDAQTAKIHPESSTVLAREHLEQAARTNEALEDPTAIYIPVRLGTRVVGSLGMSGKRLTRPEGESIANLVAIAYERMQALKRAAEAEAARQGERLKTFVLDGIAHDLKTPLTAIKTCITTLITIPPQSEERRTELLTIIDEESERLHRTISEAIQLARIESNKVALQRTTVHLSDEVERLLSEFANRERFDIRIPPDSMFQQIPTCFYRHCASWSRTLRSIRARIRASTLRHSRLTGRPSSKCAIAAQVLTRAKWNAFSTSSIAELEGEVEAKVVAWGSPLRGVSSKLMAAGYGPRTGLSVAPCS